MPKDYTRQEITKMGEEITDTIESLKEIEFIIQTETKNKNKLIPDDNIIFICPNITKIFKEIKGKTVDVSKLVKFFINWTEETYSMIYCNRARFKNKKLANHMIEAYNICKLLEQILINKTKEKET